MKKLRFNKAGLAKVIGKVNAEFLFLAGQNLRKVGKAQLKQGKTSNGERQPSKPGDPPYIWKSDSPLKKFLLYSLDPYKNSMVVGSELLSSATEPVPGILEHGGNVTVHWTEYIPHNRRKWGAKHYEGQRPKLKRPTKQNEYYTYFRSKSAWEKARNSSGFQQWAKSQNPKYMSKTITIKPRPYMQNALNIVTKAGYTAWMYRTAVQRAWK